MTAASATAQDTAVARAAGRRGRSQASRSTSEAAPPSGGEHLAGLEGGELGQRRPSGLGQPGPLQVGGQGVDRLARLPSADEPGQPRRARSQASASRVQRWATEAAHHRSKASVGSQTASPSGPVPTATRSAADATSTCRAAPRSSMCSSSAAALSSRTAEPARPQGRRRRRAPVLQQQLDVPHQLEGRPGGGPVHQGRVAGRGGQRRLRVGGRPRGAAAPQADRDLPGQRDVPPVAGHQQAARQQLVDRPDVGAARRRALGGLHRAVLALALEVLEDRPRRWVDLGDEPVHRGRVGQHRGDRRHVAVPVAARREARAAGPARRPWPGRSRRAAC